MPSHLKSAEHKAKKAITHLVKAAKKAGGAPSVPKDKKPKKYKGGAPKKVKKSKKWKLTHPIYDIFSANFIIGN